MDFCLNPSPRILESFEAWDYRNRLRPELARLLRAGLLERYGPPRASRLQSTAQGRLAADGGINPFSRWNRGWDGRWRLLLFDLPARQGQLRLTLWRWLRQHRFGYLQQSVWIVPDPINETTIPLQHLRLTPESLTVILGTPAPPDSHEALVHSAWDFTHINAKYEAAIQVAIEGRRFVRSDKPGLVRQWLAEERLAWKEAIAADPLLPAELLPAGYLGRKAYQERQMTFSMLGKALAERIK